MDTVLYELIQFLKGASPIVWETLVKQVYVDALINFLWGVASIITAIPMFRLGKKHQSEIEDYNSKEISTVLFYLLFGIASLSAMGFITSCISYLINPEFYAIKYIISSLQ